MNIIEQLEVEATRLLKQPIKHPFKNEPGIIIDANLLDPYDMRNVPLHQKRRASAFACSIKNVLGCYAWFNSNEVARIGTAVMLRNRLQQYWLSNKDTAFDEWVKQSINNNSTIYVAVWIGMVDRHMFELQLIGQYKPVYNVRKR